MLRVEFDHNCNIHDQGHETIGCGSGDTTVVCFVRVLNFVSMFGSSSECISLITGLFQGELDYSEVLMAAVMYFREYFYFSYIAPSPPLTSL